MRTSIIVARVAHLGVPARDRRILHRPRIEADTIPVFNKLPRGRELVGHAHIERPNERTSELVARLEVAPFVAAPLLQYRRFVHLEGTDGDVHRDGDTTVITGMTVRSLYVSDDPWAWDQPWVAHVEDVDR